ncbi:MAG: response regulator [Actinobacteria bacterium]|nr:response regulator [Actinomycetota bacterium]MDI6830865.1 response regulator [Actinomycetota bacterium]
MQGRILVVDDEPEILRAVKFYLEDEDFEVHVTEDGSRAAELAEALHPDLIILDVMMPVTDGIQVCRQLRSRSRTRLIPIIFLTAREAVEDKIKGLEAGGDDYVTKPFSNQELLARIKAHIKRSREELSSHPVTGLPGAVTVEDEVNRRLHAGEIFTAVFAAMEHYRPFQEAYGVSRGERLLLHMARTLEEALDACGAEGCFLGQPSYEECILLLPPDRANEVCSRAVAIFEEGKLDHYLEQHRRLGELTYYDYRGDLVRAPLVFLALGGVCNSKRFIATYAALAEWGAQVLLKARARGRGGHVLEE